MEASKLKQLMDHIEVQFEPQRIALAEKHLQELREAKFRARQTNNAAAQLPAEARCYVERVKALVIAKARCIAAAYSAFNEPSDERADASLARFFSETVAGSKAAFQGQATLRSMRTGASASQVTPLLRGFEREAKTGLVEGLAILDKQRVEIQNKAQLSADRTKYVVDTCVFNWIADKKIAPSVLPSDGGFAVTHIQYDEINKTQDGERRVRLFLTLGALHCKLVPTSSFVFDVSRLDLAKWSDGKLFNALRSNLDAANGGKKSNTRDALIAEAAIANGYTLITADKHLKCAVEKEGGSVLYFPPTET